MRPWQLTRGQRVEMEACLARLREGPHPYRRDCIGPADDTVAALRALGVAPRSVPTEDDADDGVLERLLRARVAIALRAALRADEDARCEEVLGSVTWRLGHYHGARYAVDALRAWPRLRREGDRVPLALWEVVR